MTPYYEHDGIVIYHADCREVMPSVVHAGLLITDPPYGINVDTSWLTDLNVRRGKPSCRSDAPVIGDDGTLDISWIWQYSRRVVFGHPYLFDTEATGWVVWDKQPGLDSERTLGNPVEMASTTCWSGFRMIRCLWSGYYRDGGEQRHKHPTQKPECLMQRCIKLAGDGPVLDPFMGSGTTLVAAKALRRQAIGIEIEERYCEIAANRLSQEVFDFEPEPQEASA